MVCLLHLVVLRIKKECTHKAFVKGTISVSLTVKGLWRDYKFVGVLSISELIFLLAFTFLLFPYLVEQYRQTGEATKQVK